MFKPTSLHARFATAPLPLASLGFTAAGFTAAGFTAILLSAALLTGCSHLGTAGPMQHETKSIPLDKAELTRVDIKMGAGEFTVDGGATNLLDAEFDYNVAAWKPEVEYHSTGARGDLSIQQPENMGQGGTGTEYKWKLKLNDTVGMDVTAKVGAGEAHMNLGSLNLRNVEVQMGAGELNLDLRGTPKSSYTVRVNGGVGQANIRLPKNVGISASAEGGIGSIDVHGLEQRNGRWVNAGHENDAVSIRLDIKGGVGQIEITAE